MIPKRMDVLLALLCSGWLCTTPTWGLTSISPAQPTTTDSVTTTISRGYSSTCWNYVSQASCAMSQPDTLTIQVSVNYCNGAPGCNCAQFPTTVIRRCTVTPLPVGAYVAKFVELHVNPADPLPSVTTILHFTVTESTPALSRSWGALKTIYH